MSAETPPESPEKPKESADPPTKRPRRHTCRHVCFFFIIILFAVGFKVAPWFLREVLSVQIDRQVPASSKKADKVYRILSESFGDRVTNDPDVLAEYSIDRSHHPHGFPSIVVWPETTEEVQSIVQLCRKKSMIVIPMGYNSGLEGQTVALKGGVIVNLMKMKKIVELYEQDNQVTVEPGLRISEVNDYLKPKGFFFAVSPGSNPSIGGAISTRASGTTTVKYGTMKENVISLEVVLPSGEVIRTRSRAPKSSAGFDLTSLFVGAEGLLGIVTKATLKIFKIPEAQSACVVNYKSLADAAETVIELKREGIAGLARMEIVNVEGIQVVNKFFKKSHTLMPTLFLEFHSNSAEEVEKAALEAERISKKHGGSSFRFTTEEAERKELWHIRHNAYFAASKYRTDCTKKCRLFSTDVCVPMSRFAEVIAASEVDFRENCKLLCPIVGHSGDGNFHILAPIDFDNPDEVERLEECNARLVKRAIEADGTCTGEHGIGMGKMSDLVEELGEGAVGVMKAIKKAIDKKNMFNPGKMLYG